MFDAIGGFEMISLLLVFLIPWVVSMVRRREEESRGAEQPTPEYRDFLSLRITSFAVDFT